MRNITCSKHHTQQRKQVKTRDAGTLRSILTLSTGNSLRCSCRADHESLPGSSQGVPSTTASRAMGGDAKTRDAFTPPKPKEFVMTCLGTAGNFWGCCPTSESTQGPDSGCSKFRVGGAMFSMRDITANTASTAPALQRTRHYHFWGGIIAGRGSAIQSRVPSQDCVASVSYAI